MPNYLGNDPVKMQKLADALDALRPFAKAAEYAETDETDNYGLEGSSARFELTLGDLRRAAKVLSE